MQKANKFIPVSRPTISEDTITEVVEVLHSGWLATGPRTQKFEQKLCEYFGDREVCSISSNTVGLQASLMAIGVQAGDEVIVPTLTFAATANTVASLGAKPVLVDVDKDTFNIDPDKVNAACTSKTKAIIPVHYAGIPVDLDEIFGIAKRKNLRVVEDAAHAMGSSYKGKKIGSFGDIQVFSFHPIKNMTTGEGGCVVFPKGDSSEVHKLNLQRFHGIDRSIWDRFSKNASCYYDVVFPGCKSNMSDIQAAIGLHQLEELEKMNERRRYLIARYRNAFDGKSYLTCQKDPSYDFTHSGHLFPICVEPSKKDDLMAFLKENLIGTTPYYTPLHYFSYYQKQFGYKKGDFPNAEYIGDRIICIPLYYSLSDEEQDYVIQKIDEFFKK